jgi:delta-1-pyrroline-5-carboxylate synthetase
MFSQYGLYCAQVLITKRDFKNEKTLMHLQQTIDELLSLGVIPILNENDAVAQPPVADADIRGVISVKDNDSLAARLAAQINANSVILLSDVDGVYR